LPEKRRQELIRQSLVHRQQLRRARRALQEELEDETWQSMLEADPKTAREIKKKLKN
jgi:hypothetical protein